VFTSRVPRTKLGRTAAGFKHGRAVTRGAFVFGFRVAIPDAVSNTQNVWRVVGIGFRVYVLNSAGFVCFIKHSDTCFTYKRRIELAEIQDWLAV
jgi:hypothetical protein